jgi:hypothetical protein
MIRPGFEPGPPLMEQLKKKAIKLFSEAKHIVTRCQHTFYKQSVNAVKSITALFCTEWLLGDAAYVSEVKVTSIFMATRKWRSMYLRNSGNFATITWYNNRRTELTSIINHYESLKSVISNYFTAYQI